MIDHADARLIAGMLAAIGEPTRMMVLHRLADGPAHVGRLAELVGVPMVNMSHHLGVMRQAGLLDDAKDGRRVIYSLRPAVFTPAKDGDSMGVLTVGAYRVHLRRSDDGENGSGNGAVKRPKKSPPGGGKKPKPKKG